MLLPVRALSRLSFVAVCMPVLVAPWLFAAWEMWWFWPFVATVFAGVSFFALRLMGDGAEAPAHGRARRLSVLCGAAWGLFLLYAAVRFARAEVFMDAERSLLLFLTPVLLGVLIIFGFSREQLKALSALLAVNLFLLGAYGVANHFITGNEKVMWMPGYPQYILDERATGSYYCPDHFSGVMELAFCVGVGIVLSRETRWYTRLLATPLLVVALWGVLLSKSRGGGLTIVVILGAALLWGFGQWRASLRWALRGGAALGLAALLLIVGLGRSSYIERFKAYPWTQIEASDRYQMISAALRAWKTSPVFGIGPGMHQNLWPHFAATGDGDRAAGTWPSYPNYTFHSYEVHSDWTQLLEEYGVVGLALFLAASGSALLVLLQGRWRALRRRRRGDGATGYYWTIQAALLASVAMAFHSLGDFNLQMPATVWMLAALVAVPMAYTLRDPSGANLRPTAARRAPVNQGPSPAGVERV